MKKGPYIVDESLYSFTLPEELIGRDPKDKRDESRLFVFNTQTGEIIFDQFKHISNYLPQNALLVLNETKVAPARITLFKKTGGKVELLFLLNLWKDGELIIPAIVDRKIDKGDTLSVENFSFEVVDQEENIFYFKMLFDVNLFRGVLDTHGTTPIPHYIQGVSLQEDALRTRYQTIFAKEAYSVAAPTASLHFTEHVFRDLEHKGIQKKAVTLHVGLGTFKPITKENMETKSLHKERYSISSDVEASLSHAKETKQPIIAVGTTVVRTLESFAATKKREGETTIFIHPPHTFTYVDHVITNFHLPNSSLMMLVEAFLQYKKSDKHLIDLYKKAIEESFHFYSFGDSMLIL